MKREKWDALILTALYGQQDYPGEKIDIDEAVEYIFSVTVVKPQRRTLVRHIYRLAAEGRLKISATVALANSDLELGIFRP